MYREIVTKAVIGKGKISNNGEIIVSPSGSVSKVLGCWVINHEFSPSYENGSVFVRGKYDVHIWQGINSDSDNFVHKQTIDYVEEFKVKMKQGECLNENNELVIRCAKYPTCSSLDLRDDNTISLKVEKELVLGVIGETTLRVEISQGKDDWFSDDDIANINVNYMKG